MPFLSIEFALFFMCFLPIYWLFQKTPKIQNLLLLISGLAWLSHLNWQFTATVVLFTLLISWIGQHLTHHQKSRKNWLYLGIILSLLNLSFFKYLDFFRTYFPLSWQNSLMDWLLPLGISYYTFQAIAYLVALYHRRPVFLKWHELLLHFSFMPTITSGPIIRADEYQSISGKQTGMSTQIKTSTPRKMIRPALALSLITLGILKKWWLAGTLQTYWVDDVFANPMQYDLTTILVGIYGYTLQLFFDFSGYTDLVIGIAMLLGFKLPENFQMPLRAFNIRDFWNRWHISLSTWIRDYIYIPLGGNRHGWLLTQFNLLLAMVLSGIWHGYGWNFLVWGLLHGIALISLNITDTLFGGRHLLARYKLGRAIGISTTLTFVAACFVIFKTNTLEEAKLIFIALGQPQTNMIPSIGTIILASTMLIALICYPLLVKLFLGFVNTLEKLPTIFWIIPLLIIMITLLVLAPSGIPGFIYANF